MFWLKVLFAISSLGFITSEYCELFETCGECIGNSLHCAWCPDRNHTGPRCISSSALGVAASSKSWCLKPYEPQMTNQPESKEGNQFRPSNIVIKARPGDTVLFNITYKPASDYPIDVYYLFDNSWTMDNYKKDLVRQAHQIYKTLKKESDNVRFGAGSFVEKLALPFAKEGDNTFINHLSLTNNIDIFVEIVNNTKYKSNLDDPECGFDALMQAMTCEEEIGWRSGARRIIILSTDQVYHSAGDGRAVGAYKQNDMKCHLKTSTEPNVKHTYDHEASLLYDYPSVSQISYIAGKKDITIFFVAKKEVAQVYEALVQAVFGAQFVELAVDKNNNDLPEIIKKQYKSLQQNLEISSPKMPSHLQLNLNPDCSKNNKCAVPHRGSKLITASLYVKSCPSDNRYKHTFTIKAAGLADKITVEVEVLCECYCEKSGQKKSPMCSINGISHGTYQCGVCKCDDGWHGKTCECAGASTAKEDLRKCTPSSASGTAKPCSGRGNCSCGVCKCWEGYDDTDQCQHRTDDCPTYEEKVCAGHGKCVSGNCKCTGPWKGASCACSTNKDTCIGANGQICSGNGNCECGECVCKKNEIKNYEGKFCDKCDTCGEERCLQLKDYVLCNYDGNKFGDKKSCDIKQEIKTNIKVEIKNQTEIEGWSEGFYCKIVLSDESSIIYKYLDGNNSTLICIQKEKELPPERNIWVPIGIAIGTILLVGILTVIVWKVLVDIHDTREYRKFASEMEKSGFDVMENPLYKPAAVSINNPAYNERG